MDHFLPNIFFSTFFWFDKKISTRPQIQLKSKMATLGSMEQEPRLGSQAGKIGLSVPLLNAQLVFLCHMITPIRNAHVGSI